MSENVSSPLHDAAARGDIDLLNRLLSQGMSVDERDSSGKTALMRGAYAGQETVCRHLLKWGARVDAETPEGVTPLMMATGRGNGAIVRLLLARGADPNQVIHPKSRTPSAEDEDAYSKACARLSEKAAAEFRVSMERRYAPRKSGSDNLHQAVMSGSSDAVAALLEAGIGPDEVGPTCTMSPLRLAASRGKLDVARLLIRHGADVNAIDDFRTTPLFNAIFGGRTEAVRLLLEAGADPFAGDTPAIVFAISRTDIEMVKLLLSFGKDTNMSDGCRTLVTATIQDKPEIQALFAVHQGTEWHDAVVRGDYDAVRARLAAGADVDARNMYGKSALLLAAEASHVAIVQLLLDCGAQIEATNRALQTPLLRAIAKDHIEVVRLLVARGANVHAADRLGNTALFLASKPERRAIADILIGAGARVGIVEAARMGDHDRVIAFLDGGTLIDERNEVGATAFMATAASGDIVLATMLRERGADIDARDNADLSPFFHAVESAIDTGTTDLLELMLSWGVDINRQTEHGSTALDHAVIGRSEKILRFLLCHGADPNLRTGGLKWTALHEAVRIVRGDLMPARVLLEHGAGTEIADTMGATPLIYAVQLKPKSETNASGNEREYIHALVRLLIEGGANVNASNRMGSVLAHAARTGDIEVVRLLLDAGADVSDSRALACASGDARESIAALLRERGAPDLFVGVGRDDRPIRRVSPIAASEPS